MTNDNTKQIILGQGIVEHEAEAEQHPGQVRGGKDKEAEEAEAHAGVAAGPDVDEAEAEGRAQEGHGGEGRQGEQRGGGVEQQPGKVGGAAAERRLLQVARVARHEEEVEHEVERQRAKVQERGQHAPVLALGPHRRQAEKELEGRHHLALHQHRRHHRRRRPHPRHDRHVIVPLLQRVELCHRCVLLWGAVVVTEGDGSGGGGGGGDRRWHWLAVMTAKVVVGAVVMW